MAFPLGVFRPFSNTSISLANTSANASLGTIQPMGRQIMVTSPSANPLCFIKLGSGASLAATTSDTPILPGTVQTFGVIDVDDHIAAIVASGTGTLYITIGDGN